MYIHVLGVHDFAWSTVVVAVHIHVHVPSQFSRLGIQVSLAIYVCFFRDMVGWVILPFFSFIFL